MATNLDIDNKLLELALRLGGLKTKRATVNEALKEFVLRRKQKKIKELFGAVEYEEDYDYKESRKR